MRLKKGDKKSSKQRNKNKATLNMSYQKENIKMKSDIMNRSMNFKDSQAF